MDRGLRAALAQLGTDGALVTKSYAEDHDLAVGERLSIDDRRRARSGRSSVRGIYDPPEVTQLLGDVTHRPSRRSTTAFPQPQNSFTFLDAGRGREAGVEAAAAGFPTPRCTPGGVRDGRTQGLRHVPRMLYVLLGFSVVVSLFGMVNTLVLSVFERTRELGMLRAIGMTRRQARRMIRQESVITALIGAALGLPLGVFLAALVTQALSEYDIGLSIPSSS